MVKQMGRKVRQRLKELRDIETKLQRIADAVEQNRHQ
jgi:hypothetical protein